MLRDVRMIIILIPLGYNIISLHHHHHCVKQKKTPFSFHFMCLVQSPFSSYFALILLLDLISSLFSILALSNQTLWSIRIKDTQIHTHTHSGIWTEDKKQFYELCVFFAAKKFIITLPSLERNQWRKEWESSSSCKDFSARENSSVVIVVAFYYEYKKTQSFTIFHVICERKIK